MTTYYAKSAMNFSAANGWNTQADGNGTDWTYTSGANVLDLNSKAVTLDVDVTCTEITSAASNGYLTVGSTRTINANITYSGLSNSGMVRVGSGGALTVNGQLSGSSSGYVCVLTNGGTLELSNSGSPAINCSAGRGVSNSSNGAITIVGDVVHSGTGGYGVYCSAGQSCTLTITGNVTAADGYGVYIVTGYLTITGNVGVSGTGYGVLSSAVTTTIDGNISGSGSGAALTLNGGTGTWTGSRSVAASEECFIFVYQSATLVLATASEALSLSNSGTVVIRKTVGDLTITAAGGTASIVNQTSSSYAALVGCSDTEKAIISGPTLPAANNVIYGSGQYGYAGGLLTPNYAPPCNGSAPYTADASKVLTTGYFGTIGSLTQGTGSGGGGYTYGDNDASKVLTTATGAGTYQAVTAANVRKGVAVGVSPAVGTLVGIVDSGGTQHDYGTCDSSQAYNATGVIYGTGSYATEASRNTDPGAAYVLTGHNYTIAGAAKTASYSPDFPAVGNVLSTDTVNGLAGTLTLPAAGYVLTSAWGGPAAYGVGGNGSTPTATLTAGANVWHTAAAFGASGSSITPSKVGSSITNLSAANVKKNVVIDNVTGAYDPMAAAVFPAAANVSNVETAYGPTGAEYAGSLNMSLYTLISGVVAASNVRHGTARYSGGSTGTCYVPAAADVQSGVNVDATTGTFTSPAVAKVLSDTSWGAGGTEFTGTYHAPEAGEVISTAVFGAGGATSGTYDVSNVAAGNIRDTVSIGGVTGSFTHTAAYVAKSDVVDADYVVVGNSNYVGGSAGTYPTTATSQAAQLAADRAAVEAEKASVLNTATILGVAGTYDPDSGYDSGFADGQTAQLVIDAAAVDAAKAGITTTTTLLGVAGTLDLDLYTLIANVVDPIWVATGHTNYVGGEAGTYEVRVMLSSNAKVIVSAEC